MEKAVVLFLICCLAVFGVLKLAEFMESIFALHCDEPIFLICKPQDTQNIEMIVRSLGVDREKISAPKVLAIIIDDNLSAENKEVCRKTAEKLNTCICSSKDVMEIIDRKY